MHSSQWITLPSQSCLVILFLCQFAAFANYVIDLFVSPHNLCLLFCCVISILALMWLVLMALFFSAIRRDSVSLLRFSFLCRVHVFSCERSFVSHLKPPQSCFLPIFAFWLFSLLLLLLLLLFLEGFHTNGGFSLECEWRQVSSSFEDFSRYSSQS